MRVSTTLPFDRPDTGSEFWNVEAVATIGAVLERAGFAGACVTDHPAPPQRWLEAGGHHAQDPFVMLSLLAAVTSTLELQTGVLVLPYRNPLLTARALSTLDRFSEGRVVLGVGAGYLKGEFRALGVDFDRRNELTDEYLLALKAAWGGARFTLEGTGYRAAGNRIVPGVMRQPHPPILVGGNSRRAIRRAVAHGDSWNPFITQRAFSGAVRTAELSEDTHLAEGIRYLRACCDTSGRQTPPGVVVAGLTQVGVAWEAQAVVDHIERLAALGVSGVGVQLAGRGLHEWCDEAERFGRDVIGQLS